MIVQITFFFCGGCSHHLFCDDCSNRVFVWRLSSTLLQFFAMIVHKFFFAIIVQIAFFGDAGSFSFFAKNVQTQFSRIIFGKVRRHQSPNAFLQVAICIFELPFLIAQLQKRKLYIFFCFFSSIFLPIAFSAYFLVGARTKHNFAAFFRCDRVSTSFPPIEYRGLALPAPKFWSKFFRVATWPSGFPCALPLVAGHRPRCKRQCCSKELSCNKCFFSDTGSWFERKV